MRRRGGWGWIFFWPIAPILMIARIPAVQFVVTITVATFWVVLLILRAIKKGVTGK